MCRWHPCLKRGRSVGVARIVGHMELFGSINGCINKSQSVVGCCMDYLRCWVLIGCHKGRRQQRGFATRNSRKVCRVQQRSNRNASEKNRVFRAEIRIVAFAFVLMRRVCLCVEGLRLPLCGNVAFAFVSKRRLQEIAAAKFAFVQQQSMSRYFPF